MSQQIEKPKAIIHIGGTAYSGSTLLDLMLSNTKNAFSCGEVFAAFRPFRMHHFTPSCSCGDPDCHIWDNIIQNGEKELWHSLSLFLPDIYFFIDSSKSLVWLKDSMDNKSEEFNHINLLIWKSPEEYAYSRMKRGKLWGWRNSYINYHEKYFSIVNDWYSIRYSDMAKNPDEKLKAICRVANIPFHSDMKDYWKKQQHHSLFGSYSAKLHLYNKDSNDYRDIAERRSDYKPKIENGEDFEITKHKTIYYDKNTMGKLKPSIQRVIKTDKRLQKITEYLKERDVGNTETESSSSYKYSWNRGIAGWYMLNKLKRILKFYICKSKIAIGSK